MQHLKPFLAASLLGIYTLLRVFVHPVTCETKFQTHTKRTSKIATHGNQT